MPLSTIDEVKGALVNADGSLTSAHAQVSDLRRGGPTADNLEGLRSAARNLEHTAALVAEWAARQSFEAATKRRIAEVKNKLTPMAMMLNDLNQNDSVDNDEVSDARQGLKAAVKILDDLWHLTSGSNTDEVQRLIDEPDEGV